MASGPLAGLRVVELVGQGPGPFGAALLADLGCDVVCVERAAPAVPDRPPTSPMLRGKRSVVADVKDPEQLAAVVALAGRADVFIDPFRPGVCERLGLGPEVLGAANPRLIYVRMTGWGQDGPLARAAGHDLNYIALAGALDMFGSAGGAPVFPINILGDFAAGGVNLVVAVACAAYERERSGRGQVVDVAMVDGVVQLLGPLFVARVMGGWGPRGTNHLDGAAPFYNVYRTADDRWVTVAAIEPQFHAELYRRVGLDEPPQWDRDAWPVQRERLAALFATRTMAAWCELLEGTETCFAPVLTPGEVATHPHTAARRVTTQINGTTQPTPAPRFLRTPGAAGQPCHPGQYRLTEVLDEWTGKAD